MLVDTLGADKILSIVEGTRQFFRQPHGSLSIREKGTADYVTEIDCAVQSFIWENLRSLSSGIQFMGEEQENNLIDRDMPCWILDPVDGTTNLIHDFRHSAVSLALVEHGAVTFGAVYHPYLHELFYAVKGRGAYCNHVALPKLPPSQLSHTIVCVGTNPYSRVDVTSMFRTIQTVFSACEDIRRSGSAALDLVYVASGRAGGYFESNLKPWDFAAGSLVLEEVGGRITDYSGNALDLFQNNSIIAGEKHVHSELLKLIT